MGTNLGYSLKKKNCVRIHTKYNFQALEPSTFPKKSFGKLSSISEKLVSRFFPKGWFYAAFKTYLRLICQFFSKYRKNKAIVVTDEGKDRNET